MVRYRRSFIQLEPIRPHRSSVATREDHPICARQHFLLPWWLMRTHPPTQGWQLHNVLVPVGPRHAAIHPGTFEGNTLHPTAVRAHLDPEQRHATGTSAVQHDAPGHTYPNRIGIHAVDLHFLQTGLPGHVPLPLLWGHGRRGYVRDSCRSRRWQVAVVFLQFRDLLLVECIRIVLQSLRDACFKRIEDRIVHHLFVGMTSRAKTDHLRRWQITGTCHHVLHQSPTIGRCIGQVHPHLLRAFVHHDEVLFAEAIHEAELNACLARHGDGDPFIDPGNVLPVPWCCVRAHGGEVLLHRPRLHTTPPQIVPGDHILRMNALHRPALVIFHQGERDIGSARLGLHLANGQYTRNDHDIPHHAQRSFSVNVPPLSQASKRTGWSPTGQSLMSSQ